MGFVIPIVAALGTAAAAAEGTAAAGGTVASAIGAAGTAASIAGTAVSAIGAAQSAQAQSKAASYQSQVAANQQQVATQQGNLTVAQGEAQEAQQGLKNRANIGAIKAAQAASGTDVDTGSNVDVRSSSAELGQLDQATLRSNSAQQAYGYFNQATTFGGQAQLEQAESSQALAAGQLGVAGSLFSGASSVAKNYAAWQAASGGGPTTNAAGGNASSGTSQNQVYF